MIGYETKLQFLNFNCIQIEITLDNLALACAVDKRISVSRALAVTGCVLAVSAFSKSCDRNFAYSSPIISQASSVKDGFMHLAISIYFLTNSGDNTLSFDLVEPRPPSFLSHIGVSLSAPSASSYD